MYKAPEVSNQNFLGENLTGMNIIFIHQISNSISTRICYNSEILQWEISTSNIPNRKSVKNVGCNSHIFPHVSPVHNFFKFPHPFLSTGLVEELKLYPVMERLESQKWIMKGRTLRFESQIPSQTLNFWRIAFYWIGLFFPQESDSWKGFFLPLFPLPRVNLTIKRKWKIK